MEARARGPRPVTVVTVVLLAQTMCGAVTADPSAMPRANGDPIDVSAVRGVAPDGGAATQAGPAKRLWLPQTRSDWEEMVAVARVDPARTSEASIDGFEEVLVTAPEDLLPMPGVYEKMWGGVLAPIWAVLHPTQAWRIFLPIPPQ